MLTNMEKLLFIMLPSKVILVYIAIIHLCGLISIVLGNTIPYYLVANSAPHYL